MISEGTNWYPLDAKRLKYMGSRGGQHARARTRTPSTDRCGSFSDAPSAQTVASARKRVFSSPLDKQQTRCFSTPHTSCTKKRGRLFRGRCPNGCSNSTVDPRRLARMQSSSIMTDKAITRCFSTPPLVQKSVGVLLRGRGPKGSLEFNRRPAVTGRASAKLFNDENGKTF